MFVNLPFEDKGKRTSAAVSADTSPDQDEEKQSEISLICLCEIDFCLWGNGQKRRARVEPSFFLHASKQNE